MKIPTGELEKFITISFDDFILRDIAMNEPRLGRSSILCEITGVIEGDTESDNEPEFYYDLKNSKIIDSSFDTFKGSGGKISKRYWKKYKTIADQVAEFICEFMSESYHKHILITLIIN
jgi:hypothetical protein